MADNFNKGLIEGQIHVPIGIKPKGTKDISENGTYDVMEFAEAEVSVPLPEGTTEITANGTYDVYDYAYAKVALDNKEKPMSDVMFYNYDGEVLYRFTADEFLALNEMPPGPEYIDGLIFDGWNYTLEEAKELVNEVGAADIGAFCVPPNNESWFFYEIVKPKQTINISFGGSFQGSFKVDWGDGIIEEYSNVSYSANISHEYLSVGIYKVILYLASLNELRLQQSYSVHSPNLSLIRINLGREFTNTSSKGLAYCYKLKTVSLHKDFSHFESSSFTFDVALEYITLPNNPNASKNIDDSIFIKAGIKTVSIPKNINVPSYVTSAFTQCPRLKRLIIPKSSKLQVTSNPLLEVVYLSGDNGSIDLYKIFGYSADHLWNIYFSSLINRITTKAYFTTEVLCKIVFKATTPPILEIEKPFGDLSKNHCQIIVPKGCAEAYKAATNWSDYADYIVEET